MDYMDKIKTVAELCDLVYEVPSYVKTGWADVRETLRNRYFFSHVEMFADPQRGTKGFIVGNDSICLIVFAGTEIHSCKDVWSDIQVSKVKIGDKGAKVHKGIYKALEFVDSSIRYLRPPNWETVQKVCAGHSLGGALAILSAVRYEVDGVITFGAPKVGNHIFARIVNEKLDHVRIVNKGDPVPKVPLINYWHDTPPILIGEKWDFTGDHGMGRYIEDLKSGEFTPVFELAG